MTRRRRENDPRHPEPRQGYDVSTAADGMSAPLRTLKKKNFDLRVAGYLDAEIVRPGPDRQRLHGENATYTENSYVMTFRI